MRLVLLSGPGGSGTTTMTAATAAAAADSGRRVLAVGCDPGLADVLGVALGDQPCAVDGGWSAVQVDVLARTEAHWSEIRPRLAPLLRRGGPLLPSAEELLPPPGVAELVTLAALHDWTGSGEWDLVLVDAGPPAQALRLISSAASLRWHLGRWLPAHHRATLSGLLTLAGRGDAASDLVTRLDGALIEAERLLAGPGVSVRGVTSTRSLSITGVRRLAAAVSV
ncbi:MAG: ArsA family ATPase, partial [Geodermatophilaceae bacterium]|nr:ArsA family ATPase [Geodermatophilaceae bacterium]